MMTKELPDKWVTKALADLLAGLNVGGAFIPVFTSTTHRTSPEKYILMSQQNNEDVRNKCGYLWDHSILLEVVTRTAGSMNTNSKVAAADIMTAVIAKLENLALDPASNMEIVTQVYTYPTDLYSNLGGEAVNQKFLRVHLKIN